MKEFITEITAVACTEVTDSDTAQAVKSGSLQVFGTPVMLALMEEATCRASAEILDEGETTVGISVSITHDKASGIGEKITATATLCSVDGRRLSFKVFAKDSAGDIIGKGEIERVVVNEEKFMRRVNGQ